MEHRHIHTKHNQWGIAIVNSIWERGSDEDICALVREVRKNPDAAHAVRKAIPQSKVYGWPKFFKLYIEKIYGQKG
jgi:hypothetical protein